MPLPSFDGSRTVRILHLPLNDITNLPIIEKVNSGTPLRNTSTVMNIDDTRPDTIEDLTKQHPLDSVVPSNMLRNARDATVQDTDVMAMTDEMETGLAANQPQC